MSYVGLMQYLEARLGHHQLPLDPGARDLRDLLASCALHHEVARELLHAIFKQNRCNKLTDDVERNATIDAIVPIRLKILKSETTDLDLFHFIEAWCAAVTGYFDDQALPQQTQADIAEKKPTEVVSFTAFRSRRFKSLA